MLKLLNLCLGFPLWNGSVIQWSADLVLRIDIFVELRTLILSKTDWPIYELQEFAISLHIPLVPAAALHHKYGSTEFNKIR